MISHILGLSITKSDGFLVLAVISGIFGVTLSSVHLSQFPHGTIVMPWNFPIIVVFLVAISGLFLGLSVFRRPRHFLPILLMTNLVTSGIYVLRFPIYDEYLTAWVTMGALLAVFQKRIGLRPQFEVPQVWKSVFLLLMAHLLVMSLVGAVWTGNLKALRFSVVYAEVALCIWLLVKYSFPLIERNKLMEMILSFSLYYYVAVLLHKLLAIYYGYYQAVVEAIGFGGTSYLTLIGVICVPVSVHCLNEKDCKFKSKAYAVICLSLLIAILADSRAGILPFLVTIVVAPIIFSFGKQIKALVVSAAIVMLAGWLTVGRASWILDMGDSISRTFNIGGTMTYNYYGRQVTAASGDTGRFIYVEAASRALFSNPLLFLVGGGSYSYFPIVQPFITELSAESGSSTNVVNQGSVIGGIAEPPRPPAMGAMIIEAGMVGILLTGMLVFITVSYTVFRRSRLTGNMVIARSGILLGTIPLMLPLWSFFAEFQDAIIVYLILAPFGLLHLLGREGSPLAS
jgi:hypothetical protein